MRRMDQHLDVKERVRRQRVGLIRSLILLAGLVALTVFLALRPHEPEVVNVIMATALDDAYRPVTVTDVYGPRDTFFASVELRGYQPEMELRARWRYEGQVIRETLLTTQQAGDGYAGFVLSNQGLPWPLGNWTVEIVYEGEVLGQATFRVEE